MVQRNKTTSHGAWKKVIFAAECEPDGSCPVCGIDYAECPCPGPTMEEEFEYRTVAGILWAKPRATLR